MIKKIGYAQAVTLYSDRWRAGLIMKSPGRGRNALEQAVLRGSAYEESVRRDVHLMRHEIVRRSLLAADLNGYAMLLSDQHLAELQKWIRYLDKTEPARNPPSTPKLTLLPPPVERRREKTYLRLVGVTTRRRLDF